MGAFYGNIQALKHYTLRLAVAWYDGIVAGELKIQKLHVYVHFFMGVNIERMGVVRRVKSIL